MNESTHKTMMTKPLFDVKAILLDLDGTIVDSKDAYKEAVETASRASGLAQIDPKMTTEVPKRLENNHPLNDILGEIDPQKFLKTYLATYYQATFTKSKPISNIQNTLEQLSQKAKLAIITMRHVPNTQITNQLKKLGIAKYFQTITTALDTNTPKPSPDAIIKCTRHMHVQPCQCLIVGDSPVDIKAGKTAGTKTIAVLSGIYSRQELEKENPDLILENINQLPNYIK